MDRPFAGCRAGRVIGRSTALKMLAGLLCAIVSVASDPYILRAQQIPLLPENRPSVRMTTVLPVVQGLGSSAPAETLFSEALRQEDERRAECVDLYYRAAIRAWHDLERVSGRSAASSEYPAAWQLYQRSLARLIPAASRFGRLDPRAHLIVNDACGRRAIRVVHTEFAWKPSDFCQVIAAAEYRGQEPQRHYRAPGLGTSLIVLRRLPFDEPFLRSSLPFAATAVLHPLRCAEQPETDGLVSGPSSDNEVVLEFLNPYVVDSYRLGTTRVRLERDLSAPLAYIAQKTPRNYLEGFLDPGETDVQPKLLMLEPYQRGKIPVIFVHGLMSDPLTWLDAVNELLARPDLYRHYQVWYYRYPTGGALLESAATLREQMLLAREHFDADHCDAALDRMVLVGHSMGGLVSRLQVTYSSDILWRHAARQPLETVRTTSAMRERLERDFFFDPSPVVGRVIFIGTPHRGASMARRLVGRFASSLVRPFGAEEPQYRRLMDQNPNVFYEYLRESPPTSIDLLEPDNPLLKAMAQMPFGRGVRLHSIIGTGGGDVLAGEPTDGIVPLSSARLAGVSSELRVPVRHSDLHRDPAALDEVVRILRDHARESRR
jgi:pimeloyl-ACP methyl ester carboxylesterase